MKQAKVGFVSLGCPKNLVDSERILTQLRAEGNKFYAGNKLEEAGKLYADALGRLEQLILR